MARRLSSVSVSSLLLSAFVANATPSTSPTRYSSTEVAVTCQPLDSINKVRLTQTHCEAAFFAFADSLLPRVSTKFTQDHDPGKHWADGFVQCPNSTVISGCNITFDILPPYDDRPVQLPEIGFAALNLIEQCVGTNGSDGGFAVFYSQEKPVQVTIGHEISSEKGIANAGSSGESTASVPSVPSPTAATPPTQVTKGSGPYAKCDGYICVP